jgi:hypothetical protein
MHGQRLLVTGFRPGPAGVGRVMMNLINGFARAGIEVHVLVGLGHHPELDLAVDGVRVRSLDMQGREAPKRVRSFLAELAPRLVLSNRDDANALVVGAAGGLPRRPVVALRVGIHVPEKSRDKNSLALKPAVDAYLRVLGLTAPVAAG